jgi:hypothetical protein
MKISVFKSLYKSDERPYEMDAVDVYDMIRNPKPSQRAEIDYLRAIYPSKAYDDRKKGLLSIQFNGTFSSRRETGLIEHSGLMIIDLDKIPGEAEYQSTWQMLLECPYVYMMFRSPSGMGIKAAIRIPKSTGKEHRRRFEAFKKYINSEFWDDSGKDISRTCFYSYDENAYLNENAVEYTEIEPEKGHKVIESMPDFPITDEDEIIRRLEKFDYGTFASGQRNEYLFKKSCTFCEYGVSEISAQSYFTKYVSADFDEEEVKKIVKNAYRKAAFGTRVFENTAKRERAAKMMTQGFEPKVIAEKLSIPENKVREMKAENEDFETFWTSTEKKGKIIINISPILYTRFLERNGFAKFYPESTISSVFVRVIENKVNLVSETQIKDFVLDYLKDIKQFDVWDHCASYTSLFSERYLSMLRSINLRMLSDTKDSAYIPFRNLVVKITPNQVETLRYIDVDGYIWNDQIIQRDFVSDSNYSNDFQDFVSKVSAENIERTEALESTIGYLLHTYKDKTDQKAIIFNDQEIDDNPNGGSGKSLMLTALGYLRKSIKIDGKSFNPHKSDFVYQRVTIDTQILCFDDVKRNFDFEQLFSLITEGITVNRKNKDEIFIPFERSPKIVITTNYVISGAGTSHDRRRHELEFNQYFNNKRTPLTEYGRLLFDSWETADWIKFDNYMIKCLQMFLEKGLKKPISINTEAKKLIQSTCKDFYDWVMDGNLPADTIYVGQALVKFKEEYTTFKDLAPKVFSRWIQSYLEYANVEYHKGRESRGTYFQLDINNTDIHSMLYD